MRASAGLRLLDETDIDLGKLAEFPGSGRAVGAVMRLAIGLCDARHCPMSQQVLDDAIGVWKSFHKDLANEGVAETWEK